MAKLAKAFSDLTVRLTDDTIWKLNKISYIDGKVRESYYNREDTYIFHKLTVNYTNKIHGNVYKLEIECRREFFNSIEIALNDANKTNQLYSIQTIECCNLFEQLLMSYEDYAGYPFDDIIYEVVRSYKITMAPSTDGQQIYV